MACAGFAAINTTSGVNGALSTGLYAMNCGAIANVGMPGTLGEKHVVVGVHECQRGGIHRWLHRAGHDDRVLVPLFNHRWSVMNMPGSRLSLQDRVEMQVGIARGLSDGLIGSVVSKDRTTVFREIRVGGGPDRYCAYSAHARSRRAARRPKPLRLPSSLFCVVKSRKDSRNGGHRRRSRWLLEGGCVRRRSNGRCTPDGPGRSVSKRVGASSRNDAPTALACPKPWRNATCSAQSAPCPPGRPLRCCAGPVTGKEI